LAEKTLQYQGMTVYKAKYDLIFKEVFLGDLALLASLLSSILEIDIQAEYLAVLNTELVPAYESGSIWQFSIRNWFRHMNPAGFPDWTSELKHPEGILILSCSSTTGIIWIREVSFTCPSFS